MTEYCPEYVEGLQRNARDMAAAIEKISEAVRTMPNMGDEPERAEDHFETIVDARLLCERELHYYHKHERNFSND